VKFKHISVVNLTVVFCCKLHSNRRFVRQNVILRKPPVQTHSQFEEISANSEESYRMFGLKRNQFAETTKPHTEWSLTIFMTWHNLPQVKAGWKWSPPSLTDDFHLVATLLITVWSYCPEWQTISSRLCPPPACVFWFPFLLPHLHIHLHIVSETSSHITFTRRRIWLMGRTQRTTN